MSDVLPTPEEIAGLPEDGGPEFNRLVFERSPYLLQHARNPVDWYPWGEEAFQRARDLDRPLFLSVGYSTCHWCHVMERESFERTEVADLLNSLYVPVKVDREERPDIDEIYMAATQMLTGRGGWPMSVWLTPDARPYFAGTYFPREDRSGWTPGQGQMVQPGFMTILWRLSEMWKERRSDLLAQAEELSEAVTAHVQMGAPAGEEVTGDPVERAVADLKASFDNERGGFGGAPKFPPHGALRLLLHLHEAREQPGALHMVKTTLRHMAEGGVHDHIGGGFHRYSTDAIWFLPHFEKMLYDNAQLGRVYADAHRLSGEPLFREVSEGIFGWVLREMRDEGGGFTSALDADSEGEEGTFYVWTPSEVCQVLGQERGERFCRIYQIQDGGNWYDEASRESQTTNIPHLSGPLEDAARAEGMALDALAAELQASRESLYEVRVKRIWPHLDDKVLTSWNGLMIGALAYGGRILDRADWIEAATDAATFALDTLWIDGRLLATYRAGGAKLNAYLDDYAYLADGLLELDEATGDPRWREAAREMADAMIAHFADPDGGFFFTSDDHEELLVRSKSGVDRAIPSGNGVAARVLTRLAQLTGDGRYRTHAEETLRVFSALMNRFPRATESLLLAQALSEAGTVTIRDWEATEAEAQVIEDIYCECFPTVYPVGDALRLQSESLRTEGSCQLVAETATEVVGFARIMRNDFPPPMFFLLLGVEGSSRNQGLGRRLLSQILDRARAHAPIAVQTPYYTSCPWARRFLENAGFHQVELIYRSEWRAETDVPQWALDKHAGVVSEGIHLMSLDAFQSTRDDWMKVWWELDNAALQDIPTDEPLEGRSLDAWSRGIQKTLDRGSDTFLAVDGEVLVGVIHCVHMDADTLMIGHNSVAASHRRRGISTALKVEVLRHVVASGRSRVWTHNHEHNPIYELNLAFGFEKIDTCILMQIDLPVSGVDGGPPSPTEEPGEVGIQVRQGPVTALVRIRDPRPRPGGSVMVEVTLHLEPGFHVQANRVSGELLTPTQLVLQRSDYANMTEVRYPEGEVIELGGDELRLYGTGVQMEAEIQIAEDTPIGPLELDLVLRFQPCDDRSCQRAQSAELPFVLEISTP